MKAKRLLSTLAMATSLSAFALQMPASAKELKSIGITVGSLGNPFFVAIAAGAKSQAIKINPGVQINTVSSDYDLNKQFTQIDNFIAAGVDMILLNAVDPHAILPAVKKAEAAGIVVVAVDVAADGADATVQTNNIKAGEEACQFIADKLHNKGDVLIINGPQVSSVVERVKGCEQVLVKDGIKIMSDNQDAKGSRDGGFSVMQSLLTRFQQVDAVFAINDPTAIGAELAAKQLHRTEMVITSVDGAPDIEAELKNKDSLILASASQNPYAMAIKAVSVGNEILSGKKPAEKVDLIPPELITRENIGSYHGWASH